MKKTLFTTLIILAAFTMVWTAQAQEQDRLDVTASVTYASKYVWRGQLLTDGAVLQPSFEIAAGVGNGAVAVSGWANMDVDDINGHENEATEYNWTLSYRTGEIGLGALPIELEIGVISYYFPHNGSANRDDDALDVFGIFAVPLSKQKLSMKAFAAGYFEADDTSGWYVKGGLTGGMQLNDTWGLEFVVSVGWGSQSYNSAYFGPNNINIMSYDRPTQNNIYRQDERGNALNDATGQITLIGQIDKNVSLRIGVGFSEIIDSDIEKNAEILYGDSDNFWFFSSLSASF
jgi:hypothetical protein